MQNISVINKPSSKIKFSIIIPMAGMGNRMKSYGAKSLLKVGNSTVVENQLRFIYRYLPKCEIICVTGFQKEKVDEYIHKLDHRIKIVHNDNYENTNVVRSIGIGLNHTKYNNVIVIYGDLFFNAYTLKAPFDFYSMVLFDKKNFMKKEECGCIIQDHMLQNMMYDIPNKWAQISYFCGKELELLKKICNDDKYHMYFGFEIINIILNSGGRFSAYSPQKMKITDIDSSKDLIRAQEMFV